jgi:hypothetical protein
MTNQQHPITPPPELIKQWYMEATGPDYEGEIARRAAQWGADQELEACRREIIDGVGFFYIDETSERVRLTEDIWTARRPKPPSLKEQSIALIDRIQTAKKPWDISELDTIRRTLEQLDD